MLKTIFDKIKFPTGTTAKVGPFPGIIEAAKAAKLLTVPDGTWIGTEFNGLKVTLVVTTWA